MRHRLSPQDLMHRHTAMIIITAIKISITNTAMVCQTAQLTLTAEHTKFLAEIRDFATMTLTSGMTTTMVTAEVRLKGWRYCLLGILQKRRNRRSCCRCRKGRERYSYTFKLSLGLEKLLPYICRC